MGRRETEETTTTTTTTTTMRRATAANAVLSATVLVALIASPLARANPAASAPVVSTTAGKVQGELVDGIYTFKGIPFAADTGGANRWTAPKDPEPWSAVRKATTFMDWCPQPVGNNSDFAPAGTPMSEDCLGLNVYTPSLDEKLPVMVWIHGGGLMHGAGSTYPPQAIVKTGDVIVVTIDYRLGFLGYFAHPELNGTNFGLLDQVKALEWVRDNIENFGGDPSNVTIFGESAGGTSVLSMMVSPVSEGLFQRVITESAGIDESPNVTVSEASTLGVVLGEQLGLPAGAGQLEKMRALSAKDIVDSVPEMMSKDVDNEIATSVPLLFVDKETLPKCIWCAFAESDQGSSVHKDVALLIGTNQNETNSGAATFNLNTTDAYKAWVEKTFDPENAEKLLSVFPGSPDPSIQSTALQTAIQFGAPSHFVADRNSNLGNPTFMYYFTQAPNTTDGQKLGAYHGSEIPYLFVPADYLHFFFDDNTPLPVTPETRLAKDMQTYWTNFAKSGNPSNGGSGSNETLPEWKAYDDASPTWQVLSNAETGSEPVPEDMLTLYSVTNTLYPNDVATLLLQAARADLSLFNGQ